MFLGLGAGLTSAGAAFTAGFDDDLATGLAAALAAGLATGFALGAGFLADFTRGAAFFKGLAASFAAGFLGAGFFAAGFAIFFAEDFAMECDLLRKSYKGIRPHKIRNCPKACKEHGCAMHNLYRRAWRGGKRDGNARHFEFGEFDGGAYLDFIEDAHQFGVGGFAALMGH